MPYELTDRELQVLRLVVRGRSDRQVGDDLFVSVLTIAKHLQNIAAKVGVETREELIERAVREGLG